MGSSYRQHPAHHLCVHGNPERHVEMCVLKEYLDDRIDKESGRKKEYLGYVGIRLQVNNQKS
jgi:hypothetical protein